MCSSSYGSLLPSFILICEGIAKKSPENYSVEDRQNDRVTARITDRQKECKPKVSSGFTGWGLIKRKKEDSTRYNESIYQHV